MIVAFENKFVSLDCLQLKWKKSMGHDESNTPLYYSELEMLVYMTSLSERKKNL